jgi:hypothetical protein
MIIITYVDDCIIVGHSMKDINTFVESMKHGPEGYVLTDEGDIKKNLGIIIKESWNQNIRNYKEQIQIITTIPNRMNSQPTRFRTT